MIPVRSIAVFLLALVAPMPAEGDMARWLSTPRDGQPIIERPAQYPDGGYSYRLIYRVDVPFEVYWRFKTDFQNDFLLSNRHILSHRLVSRKGTSVITENRYATAPEVVFRWRTTVNAAGRSLQFRLMNPEACGHRYHYGRIRIVPDGNGVVVIQEAFFDFFGAGFWTRYPWAGGMNAFLEDTARWERETAVRLRPRYEPHGER